MPPTPTQTTGRDTAARLAVVRRMLAALRHQARRWIWIESLALFCLAGAAVFWTSLAFDWLVEPPAWVRAVIGIVAISGGLALLAGKLVARLAVPLDDASIALLAERRHPDFRDSLSTAVELSTSPRADIDGELLDRTIDEAAAVAERVDAGTLFRGRRLVGLAAAGLAAAASIGCLAVARPAITDLWQRRMVWLGDDPWPRRVKLSIEGFPDGERLAARGGDLEVVVKAAAEGELPAVVDLRSRGSSGWRTDRMGMRGGAAGAGQTYGHLLKGLTEDMRLEVRGGDARLTNLRVRVVDSPVVESLRIRSTPPAYLGAGVRDVPASRIVQVPRGSMVEIECRSSKPLAEASVTAVVDGREERIAALQSAAGATPPPQSISARVEAVEGEKTLVVRLTDTDGLVNREPISFVLAAVADEPPRVAVRLHAISTAVTPQATLPVEGTISDDHGLAAAAVRIRVVEGGETVLPITRLQAAATTLELPPDQPDRVLLAPLGLEPGKKLELLVTAEDGCMLDAGPNIGGSDTWTVDVVTPEALQAMLEAREIILRRRFESVIADLTQVRDRLASGQVSPLRPPPTDPEPADRSGATTVDAEQPSEDRKAGAAGDEPRNEDGEADQAARLAEAASRAAGESAEIAGAFRLIRDELDNNLLLTDELERRLLRQIAEPLAGVATRDLPGLAVACRSRSPAAALVARADDVLARMRAILDTMMELESFNEVVERLRGMIRTQEEIRGETIRRQKQRAREALERP